MVHLMNAMISCIQHNCVGKQIQDMEMDKDEARISVHVQPNAKRNEIVGLENGFLRVRITAQPVKNKANKQLIEFLSKQLGVSKSRIVIEKGEASKRKTVMVEGLSRSEVIERLGNLV